jgi:Tfp pilus assembly protein PilE
MENDLPNVEETQDAAQTADLVARRGSALPLILTMVALLVWFAFQTFQLFVERNSLSELKTNLEQAMQEAQKMQLQLQSLIKQTVELADQGNAAAKTAVSELEKRGIPLKGSAPQPAK